MDQLATPPSLAPLPPPAARRSWVGLAAVTGGALVTAGLVAVFGWYYMRPALSPAPEPYPSEEQVDLLTKQYNQGQLAPVIETTDAILAEHPEDVGTLLFQAAAWAQRGSLEYKEVEYGGKAIEIARRALELDPQSAEAYRITGYANEIMQRFPESLEAYTTALGLDPDNPEILTGRGHAYDLSGDFIQAKADYARALELDPNYLLALQNMGRISLRENNYQQAKEFFSRVAAQTNNKRMKAEALYNLSTIAYSLDDSVDQSLTYAQQAVTLDDQFPEAHVALARVYIRLDRFEEAAAALSKALTLYPDLTFGYEWLGVGYMKLGQVDLALQAFQDGRAAAERDIHLMKNERRAIQARFDYYLAAIYALQDKKEAALQALRAALASPERDMFTVRLMIETIRQGKSGYFANLVGMPEFDQLATSVVGETLVPPPGEATTQQPLSWPERRGVFDIFRTPIAQAIVIEFFPHRAAGFGTSLDWFDTGVSNLLKAYVSGSINYETMFTECNKLMRAASNPRPCDIRGNLQTGMTIGCGNVIAAQYIPDIPDATDSSQPGCTSRQQGKGNNFLGFFAKFVPGLHQQRTCEPQSSSRPAPTITPTPVVSPTVTLSPSGEPTGSPISSPAGSPDSSISPTPTFDPGRVREID